MGRLRDRAVIWVAWQTLALATPRTRARIRVALLRSASKIPPAELLERAELSRAPGE